MWVCHFAADDKEYRAVNPDMDVRNAESEPFRAITDGQTMEYVSDGFVCEIKKMDGSRRLEYGGAKGTLSVVWEGLTTLKLKSSVYLGRLWLVDKGNPCVRYKLPTKTKTEDGYWRIEVPAGRDRTRVCGDAFFSLVYEIQG